MGDYKTIFRQSHAGSWKSHAGATKSHALGNKKIVLSLEQHLQNKRTKIECILCFNLEQLIGKASLHKRRKDEAYQNDIWRGHSKRSFPACKH